MEPPHCPIDRIVISNTRYSNEINWTQITEKAQYQKVIEEIKVLANEKGKSIPLWELDIFVQKINPAFEKGGEWEVQKLPLISLAQALRPPYSFTAPGRIR